MKRMFEIIDTKEKAYWLGFLYADGCMKSDRYTLQICLSIKDDQQIDDFIRFIDGDVSYKKYYGPYKTSGKQVHFRTIDREFYRDLLLQGCKPKKKDTLEFKSFNNKDLDLAFLLGYYDGNGDEGGTDITCGVEKFLMDIKDFYNISNIVRITKNPYGSAFCLTLGVALFIEMINNYEGGIKRKRYIRNRKTPLNEKVNRSFNKTENEPGFLEAMMHAINTSKTYNEAAEKLGLHRSVLYKIRRRLNLVNQ